MANSLTAFDPQAWAREMQQKQEKELVALSICNSELKDILTVGTRAKFGIKL